MDHVALVTFHLVTITVGANVASRLLLKDSSTKLSRIDQAHWIFAVTLSCSSSLFLLVFAEIVDLSSTSIRWRHWQWNLYLLLFLVVVLVPWSQLYTFLRQTIGWRRRPAAYLTTLLWSLYFYLFLSKAPVTDQMSWVELSVSRIAIVGVSITSILSGFGVIHTPYTTLSYFQKPVSETQLINARNAYHQTREMIQHRRQTLACQRQNEVTGASTNSNSFSRFLPFLSGGQEREYELLKREVEQLERLADDMKNELNELAKIRERSRLRESWHGCCWNIVRHVFAIYCLYKLMATAFNVLFQRVGQSDPITNMLSVVISRLGSTEIDVSFWSQQLSFWFAGIIVLGSVRGLFQLLTKVLRSVSSSRKLLLPRDSIILFLTHVMGTYFLSTVLMMQSSLPAQYRYLISSSIGQSELDFFRSWSDRIFVVSSLLTVAVLYVIHQTSDARNLATDFADVQLLTAESGRSNAIELIERL